MFRRLSRAALVAALASRGALAQPADTPSSSALARSLFDEGVEAMRVGGCESAQIADDAACARAVEAFRQVVELSPESLGALRNLALVEVNRGHVATGAALWRELAERAAVTRNPKYDGWAELARAAAEELAPQVPRVSFEFGGRRPDSLTVDGVSVPPDVSSLELDPGQHVVVAKAAGSGDVQVRFSIAVGETRTLSLELTAEEVRRPAPQVPDAPEEEERRRTAVGPIVLGALGVGVAAAGFGFGYAAWRERRDACGTTDHCDPEGLDRTLRLARTSNVFVAVGAAGLGGAILWSVARPRDRRTAIAVELLPLPGAGVTTAW